MATVAIKQKSAELLAVRSFALVSVLLAFLIAIGKQTWEPIYLVLLSVIASWLLTDRLGWIRLNRLTGYIGMLIGAGFALSGYVLSRENPIYQSSANLDAVSRMLLYIQIPLMFQRKDKRLFEHWGVFLILELVVASLLSENAIFGMLLVPTLLAGCAAMLCLAAYVAEIELETGPTTTIIPVFQGWWIERRTKAVPKAQSIRMSTSLPEGFSSSPTSYIGRMVGVLGVGSAFFALIYFFGLPRLHTGAYEGLGFNRALVGFSGTVNLDSYELMMNDDLALRVFIEQSATKLPFQPTEPPYIRGTVADVYDGEGRWRVNEAIRNSYVVPSSGRLRPELSDSIDRVEVSIHEQASSDNAMFSLPPFTRNSQYGRIEYDPMTWCLAKSIRGDERLQSRYRYRFDSFAFANGNQLRFIWEPGEMLDSRASDEDARFLEYLRSSTAIGDESRFPGLLATRDRVLASLEDASVAEKVLKLEEYLATPAPTELKYSPNRPADGFWYDLRPGAKTKGVDPIEDFVANHRTGHCQYFASALTIMARSLGVPSRIVLGFRPQEYNDIGNFFSVRQRHAHAWVEAYLTREQIAATDIELPTWVQGGVWLRLDPTPSGEGSNAGGSYLHGSSTGQAYQTLEQIWQSGFMEYDSAKQPSVFGMLSSSANGPVSILLQTLERFFNRLQIQNLFGIEIGSVNWFNWQAGLAASMTAMVVALVARSRKRFFLPFRRRTSDKRAACSREVLNSTTYRYAQRLIEALSKLGWHRRSHQTLLEFAGEVQPWLEQNKPESASTVPELHSLFAAYYALRYGQVLEAPADLPSRWEAGLAYVESLPKHRSRLIQTHREG